MMTYTEGAIFWPTIVIVLAGYGLRTFLERSGAEKTEERRIRKLDRCKHPFEEACRLWDSGCSNPLLAREISRLAVAPDEFVRAWERIGSEQCSNRTEIERNFFKRWDALGYHWVARTKDTQELQSILGCLREGSNPHKSASWQLSQKQAL